MLPVIRCWGARLELGTDEGAGVPTVDVAAAEGRSAQPARRALRKKWVVVLVWRIAASTSFACARIPLRRSPAVI